MSLPISSPAPFEIHDERELIEKLRRHDPDGLAGLYDLHGSYVYRIVLRVVNNQSAAEDIVQETFGRIWERSNQIRPDVVTLGPWILAIARNRALDYLRLSDVRVAASAKPLEEVEICVGGKDAEAQVLSEEFALRVRNACSRLTENQRKVIELAYYHGLPQTTIAEVMHQPVGTVKSWTRSALQSLREMLRERNP